MSYITLITTLIEKLNQPTAIAVMASAGIHAALGLTLPHTPVFSSEKSQLPQPVQLLSLTPEDQSRIPEFYLPPAPPTIYEQTPIQSAFPPLDRLPTPKIPAKVSAKVPQTPVKKQSPAKFKIARKLPDSNLKINPGTLKKPVLNQPYGTTNTEGRQVVNPPNNNIRIRQRSRLDGIPILNPNPNFSGSFPIQQDNARNTPPTPLIITPPQPFPPEKDREPSIASQGEQGRDVTPDQNNTTNDEYRRNFFDWLVQNNQPQWKSVNIQGNYPKEACTQKLKGITSIGIAVNADGKPMSEPRLLKSAGYTIFDRQAQQDVKSRSFDNQTNQQTLFLVTVEFDYKEESCKAINQIVPSPQPSVNKPADPVPATSPAPSGNKPADPVPTPSPQPSGNKPADPVPTTSPQPSGNKPADPVPTTSPAPSVNKPEVPTTIPSPTPTENKPEVPTTIPSPTPTENKPEVPTTIPSPQPTRIKPADPVPTTSPQAQASQSTIS